MSEKFADAVLRALLRLYPEDFRDEVGQEWLATYRRRAGAKGGGGLRFWTGAVVDSVRNGLGERLNPAVWWRRRGNWGRDSQRAARRLIRAPIFTLTTVGTLTVGLGAFAVVWSTVDTVLLEPPAYDRPEDLYFVWRDYRAFFDLDRGWLSGPDVVALDSAGGVIEGAVAVQTRDVAVRLSPTVEPREMKVMMTGARLFDLLGVQPALGRGFAPEEEGEGRPGVVVLGYDLWNEQLGRDPAAVGREIRVNETPFTVIGVMPEGFRFARHGSGTDPESAELYVPFGITLATAPPGGGSYAGLLRATPGASREAVDAAVEAVGSRLDEQYFQGEGMRYFPVGLTGDLTVAVRPALIVLAVAAAALVLVLTVNLATLLLSRAIQRERELAVSRALGARRWTLARATLLEGGLLGLLGAVGALLLAVPGARLLGQLAPADLPRRLDITVDGSTLVMVLGIGFLIGLLAGSLPAVWAGRASLADVLRQASVRGGGGHGRLRRAMVVVQVALSLVLLSAGGVLVRSVESLLQSDPGFEATGATTFRVLVPSDRYDDVEVLVPLHDRIVRNLSAIGGVDAVGGLSTLPLISDTNQTSIHFPGAPGNTGQPDHDNPLADVVSTTEGGIDALGVRMLEGRGFGAWGPHAVDEALIDHTFAEEFFPGGTALGSSVYLGTDTLKIVGVLQQPRLYDMHSDGRGQLWLRDREYTSASLFYVVRTDRPRASLLRDIRAAVSEADPTLPVSQVRSLQEIVGASVSRERLSATLIGAFSLGALALAAMGLFGIVSAAVARRRPELMIRMALGADAGRVTSMVLFDGVKLVVLGLLIGLPGVWAAGQFLQSLLVGVSAFDTVTLLAVAFGLAAITVIACWIPARRVTRIDPARALRAG